MNQNRPWGEFITLQQEDLYQVNVIKMNPKELSNKHYHKLSCETYIIVSGQALLYIDNERIILKPENTVQIPRNISHSIKCISDEPLCFIEVKIGSYFGPDDTYRE
jgi:mannose-6-phosphate isomerase-like protein (cupin superfamily)